MAKAKSHKSVKTGTPGKPRLSATSKAGSPPTPPADAPPTLINDLPAIVKAAPRPDMQGSSEPIQTVPQELPPEKQSWYRPPDSKIRKKVEKILVLRAAGHTDRAIAKKLGATEQGIRQDVYLARKNGWLDANDEPIDLEAELAFNIERKIVRNISAALDGQMTNWQTHEMTLAAAKGRGIFKTHEKTEVSGEQMSVVAIRIERPVLDAAAPVAQIPADQMGGTPAYLEGEVVEDAACIPPINPQTETPQDS